MNKILVAALLVVSAAFAPWSPNIAELPDRTFEFERASRVFWQIWDELLCREFVRWTQTVSDDGQQPEAFSESRNALVGLLFAVFLKYAFDGSGCSAPGGQLLMSRASPMGRRSASSR